MKTCNTFEEGVTLATQMASMPTAEAIEAELEVSCPLLESHAFWEPS